MRLLVSFGVLFFSFCSGAANCKLESRFQKELQGQFQLLSVSNNSQSIDLCEEKNMARRLVEAIFFLKDLPQLNSKKDEFNNNFLKKSPYGFFQEKVKVFIFDFDNTTSDCQKNSVAYVQGGSDRSLGQVYICPRIKRVEDDFEVASILVHEAKHLEGPHMVHQVCSEGINKGRFSCDGSYQRDGSYTVQIELAVKVWRTESLPMSLRMQARRSAVSGFISRFNQKPFDLQSGSLLLDSKNELYFYGKSGDFKKVKTRVPNDTVISMNGAFPRLMLPSESKVKAYTYDKKLVNSPTDVLNRTFLSLTKQEQAKLKDTLFSREYACLLLSDELICIDSKYKKFRKKISNFRANHFVYQKGSSGLGGQGDNIKISDSEGYWHQIPGQAIQLKSSQSTDWKRTEEPTGLQDLIRWPRRQFLGLSQEGKLVKYSHRSGEWSEVDAARRSSFVQLKFPFTWSQKLLEL